MAPNRGFLQSPSVRFRLVHPVSGLVSPMNSDFTDAELEAFLDESLDPVRAAEIEMAVRQDRDLVRRMARINGRRDAGMHTLGEIWRRNQIGVPSTEDLGKYLLGILEPEYLDYIQFRLEVLRCPYTLAALADLKQQQAESKTDVATRRRKFYNSGAGLVKRDEE